MLSSLEDVERMVGEVLTQGTIEGPDGRLQTITGTVSGEEASLLASLILDHGLATTLETGVAFGLSTLAICAALEIGAREPKLHYGVDPDQWLAHDGAALSLLERYGLRPRFRLLEGPTHLMAPELLKQGTRIDLGFIDGRHNFDYSLLDFFYIDKMLRPGGFVAIHDTDMPSKKKLLRFIDRHRKYQLVRYRPRSLRSTLWELGRCVKRADASVGPLLQRLPRLVCLRKLDHWEPDWHVYRPF